jgi:plastocyanin
MRGRAIRAGLVAAAATALLALPWAGPAGAGGGCHEPLSEGTGNTVAMKMACFGPSILRVDPGTEVTFVNRDALVHNVSANGWGQYEDMYQGDAFTATFREEGVYPFACNYHAGMTGAVVVGHGTGAGSESSVMGPSAGTAPDTAAADSGKLASRQGRVASSRLLGGWIGGGIAGLALGAGLALVWRRRGGQA